MSLEAALNDNTAAVAALNANIEKMLARAPAAAKANTVSIEFADEEAVSASGAAVAAVKTESKGRGRPKKEAAEPEKKATTQAEVATTATIEEVRKAFGDYLGIDDKAERERRAENVRAILAQIGGYARATEITDAEHRAQAIFYVGEFTAGRTPNFMADDSTDEGESLI